MDGFGFMPRHLWDEVENRADNDRTTTSITALFEPKSWFTHRRVAGLDYNAENNWSLTPRQTAENVAFFGGSGLGAKSVNRVITVATIDTLVIVLVVIDMTTKPGYP